MEEFIDILDEQGRPTGNKDLRKNIHLNGAWHKTLHIFLFKHSKNKKSFDMLFQLRSKNKDIFPLKLAVTVGGHISAGETTAEAFRESQEEIGLNLVPQDCSYLGQFKQIINYKDIIDKEIHETYIHEFKHNISILKPDPQEVAGLFWINYEHLENLKKEDFEVIYSNGIIFDCNSWEKVEQYFSLDDFDATAFEYYLNIGKIIKEKFL